MASLTRRWFTLRAPPGGHQHWIQHLAVSFRRVPWLRRDPVGNHGGMGKIMGNSSGMMGMMAIFSARIMGLVQFETHGDTGSSQFRMYACMRLFKAIPNFHFLRMHVYRSYVHIYINIFACVPVRMLRNRHL